MLQSPFSGTPLGYADTVNASAGIALSGLDCSLGVRAGTKCFVAGVDAVAPLSYWTLTISAAAVNHTTVEAALGFPSMRWILDTTGGGGSVTSIASAAGTVQVTNPTGPAVNVEAFPTPYAPTVVGFQAGGVWQQTYATPTATPALLTMVAAQIPFGAATGGVLIQSTRLAFADAANAILSVVSAPGAGSVAQLNLDAGPIAGGGAQGSIIRFRYSGANNMTLGNIQGGAGSHNEWRQTFFPLAGGDSTDQWTLFFNGIGAAQPVLFASALGDCAMGKQTTLLAADVTGFAWMPTIAGPPSGVPAAPGNRVGNRQPIAFDQTDQRLYSSFAGTGVAAWHFIEFNDFAASATQIPYGGATAHTLTSTSDFLFDGAGNLTVGNGTSGGSLTLNQTGGGGNITATGSLFVNDTGAANFTRINHNGSTLVEFGYTNVGTYFQGATSNVVFWGGAGVSIAGGAKNVLVIGNRAVAPVGGQAGAVVLYSEGGSLKAQTVTATYTLAV